METVVTIYGTHSRQTKARLSIMGPSSASGYLVEMRQIGNAVQVVACDPRTLLEASIVGSAYSPDAVLRRAAIRKLEALIARSRPEV